LDTRGQKTEDREQKGFWFFTVCEGCKCFDKTERFSIKSACDDTDS
jgi:hypothetical protein